MLNSFAGLLIPPTDLRAPPPSLLLGGLVSLSLLKAVFMIFRTPILLFNIEVILILGGIRDCIGLCGVFYYAAWAVSPEVPEGLNPPSGDM